MKREKKQEEVGYIRDKVAMADLIILVDYRGLNVGEITGLREDIKYNRGEMRVVKNTLMRIAIRDILEDLSVFLRGPTAMIVASGDPLPVIKTVNNFALTNTNLKIKCGRMGNIFLDVDRLKKIARLPNREVLVVQLLNVFKSQPYRMAAVLSGIHRRLLAVLLSIQRQKKS